MDADLLAYLLDTLDPDRSRSIEEYLESSPEARRRLVALRGLLRPLDADEDPEPPADLYMNTLRAVASYRTRHEAPVAAGAPVGPPVLPFPMGGAAGARRSPWRRADVLVAASVLFLIVTLVPPGLLYLRHRQAVVACADNLRRFHRAFSSYALNHNGTLPRVDVVDDKVPVAIAGMYAPRLRLEGCWGDDMRLTCPGNPTCTMAVPPSEDELRRLIASSDARWREQVGGCYGYHIGYFVKDDPQQRLQAVSRQLGDNVPVLADCPPRPKERPDWQAANSPNHGGWGQNVLFSGGHVRFMARRTADPDFDQDFYLNDLRKLAPGLHPRDAVLAPSETSPIPPVRSED
jgi:hypothetical protein